MAVSGCSAVDLRPADEPRTAADAGAPAPGPNDAWPMASAQVERILENADFVIREHSGAGGGVTGASKLDLYVPTENLELAVKWKPVPDDLDGWNNSPRKELAAYALQKLILDPDDYVVPTSAIRCIPLDVYGEAFPDARANVDDAKCVLGVMSVWLQNVGIAKELFEPDRFAHDANYAYHLSNFNVLTYLIGHKDGRSNNFLVSTNERDRRVFAVDNGIAFDPWIYNFFVDNWDGLRVGTLSRKMVERLHGITDADLDALAVVAELRRGDDGMLHLVEPGPNLEADEGARREDGVLQFGLTDEEIDAVRSRLRDLLEAVERGDVASF